ncbi:hypothetical protein [Microvirga sp. BSC39]|uniref:hypothetical protein n=1 Tax=Microvirga sp. BSC39 TaxID=1549810 RepID=UPI0004E8D090|nr:hypothetical protein [Microvirga sp. BSC39]KFG67629.1 hypothetical protein JH26_21970 [Microvirga sp. BSC39]
MTNAANTSVANVANAKRQTTYPRLVTPKTIKEGKNKNGTELVSFIGEYKSRGSDKVRTMFHSASGCALDAIRATLKEGQPIRVFGVFDEMPADGERRAKQIFRIIGKSLSREQVAEEMQQAA